MLTALLLNFLPLLIVQILECRVYESCEDIPQAMLLWSVETVVYLLGTPPSLPLQVSPDHYKLDSILIKDAIYRRRDLDYSLGSSSMGLALLVCGHWGWSILWLSTVRQKWIYEYVLLFFWHFLIVTVTVTAPLTGCVHCHQIGWPQESARRGLIMIWYRRKPSEFTFSQLLKNKVLKKIILVLISFLTRKMNKEIFNSQKCIKGEMKILLKTTVILRPIPQLV